MFTVKNLSKRTSPRIPFKKIKEHILGKRYSLSIVLCGDTLIQKLNTTYRKKNTPTNVLSFPLEKNGGELFLNLAYIKKESDKLRQNMNRHTAYLFIHGLLHLKGYAHSSTMKKEEEKLLRYFGYQTEK